MNTSDFSFDLPGELIAQTPIIRREQSRLLLMDRYSGKTDHRRFFELPELLRGNDCLVLNDSRVLPARLIGRRETGGAVEVVLLREMSGGAGAQLQADIEGADGGGGKPGGGETECTEKGGAESVCGEQMAWSCVWECLTRPGRKTRTGTRLVFGSGELTARVTGETDGGNRLIEFGYKGVFLQVLERLGKMPLPPYIHEELQDNERYQTVYSRVVGSAAAPTAGLHFTNELLGEIGARGVKMCYITLHVGLGTFRPVKSDVVEEHKMHAEYFIITDETAETINRVRKEGGRIIAVGTTSCRALESCADEAGQVPPFSGFTDIFIYPGYRFKCVDGLITNFHLPESTLIMLVSAFAGRENVLRAYNEAIGERYRFFSFGDAMLII